MFDVGNNFYPHIADINVLRVRVVVYYRKVIEDTN